MEAVTKSKRLLNPMDTVAGILFGLIMALTFTCSINIGVRGPAEIRQLLIGAIGCNFAWGLVDATIYLVGMLSQKNRNKTIFDSVQHSSKAEKAKVQISEALPPVIVSAIGTEGLDEIRKKLVALPDTPHHVRLTMDDIKSALAIFFLVFVSTFPVVIPFLFIRDTQTALRVSNLIAIVMMFLCGWTLAKYVGFNRWKMSIAMILIGAALVAITIALGG
jgi:VIT1/CCC1 family predicted Fe2+/Mn2+ transporter